MRKRLRQALRAAGLALLPATGLAQDEPPAPAEAVPVETAPAEAAPVEAALPPEDNIAAIEAQLQAITDRITLSEERAGQLRAEIEALEGDRTQQTAALIAAGQRVQLAEIEVADIEQRLGALLAEENEIRARLDGADSEIATVLAALERIARNPPPALIVDPEDALGSVRGGLLISAILPQLGERAGAIRADLDQLVVVRTAAQEEEALLLANFSVLQEEQLRIATLIAARRQGAERMSAELVAEEQAAIELAARATSLQELIENLSARITSVAEAAEAADAVRESLDLTPDDIRLALADTARTQPAVPFGAARGHLTLPASGRQVGDFGTSDGRGGLSQGLSLATRPEAQVVAPADGWVMYRGPYLNYGQIVILNGGSNFTVLLAGLETVSVDLGQFVLMGEPVGTMGSRTSGRSLVAGSGNGEPTLYIELRQGNAPLDPTGWWATETGQPAQT